MHLIVKSEYLIDRVPKLIKKRGWAKEIRIVAYEIGTLKIHFPYEALECEAKVQEGGDLLIDKTGFKNIFGAFGCHDDIEIFTQDKMLILKQRNFTTSLKYRLDSTDKSYKTFIELNKIEELKKEKINLQKRIREIDQLIDNMAGLRKHRLPKKYAAFRI